MAVTPPVCDFNRQAPDFNLIGIDGKTYSLTDVSGPNGTLIMFICNHCPYVIAVLDRIMRDAKELQYLGIGVAAINSNDADAYPEDSFDNMVKMSDSKGFTFPYLHDEDQSIARAFDAACTPDFFGFNSKGLLQYRGRLDASTRTAGPADLHRELFSAMAQVAKTGKGPVAQVASMGCSIKWKANL